MSAQPTSLFAHRRSHNALDEQAHGGTANCWLFAGQRIRSVQSAAAGPLVQRQICRQGPNAWGQGPSAGAGANPGGMRTGQACQSISSDCNVI